MQKENSPVNRKSRDNNQAEGYNLSFVPTFCNLEQKNVSSKAEHKRLTKNDNAFIIEAIVAVV